MEESKKELVDEKQLLADVQTAVVLLSSNELVRPRLLATAGALIAKHLPYEARVHIYTSLTFLATSMPGDVNETIPTLALLRSLILPDKTDGWSNTLINDAHVRKALDASSRYLGATRIAMNKVTPGSAPNNDNG